MKTVRGNFNSLNVNQSALSLLAASLLVLAGCKGGGKGAFGNFSSSSSSPVAESAAGNFEGCISGEATGPNSATISYEFPSGAQKVVVMRNGSVEAYNTFSPSDGSFEEFDLKEGYTYTYTCLAEFPSKTGVPTVKVGTKVITLTTDTVNSPTFNGISNVRAVSARSAEVSWPLAYGVPTAKYVVIAKLGSEIPNSDDFDSSLDKTRDAINNKRIVRVEVANPKATKVLLSSLGDELSYQYAVQACSANNICSMGDNEERDRRKDYLVLRNADGGAPASVGATLAIKESGKVVIKAPWNPSNGKVTKRVLYKIEVENGQNVSREQDVVVVSDENNVPNELSIPLTALEGNKVYSFKVVDFDSKTDNKNNAVVSIDTEDILAPEGFGGILSLASNNEGEITVFWRWPNAGDSKRNDYAGFRVFQVVDGKPLTTSLKDCLLVTKTESSCTISGLDPYRTYSLHLEAFDASGNQTKSGIDADGKVVTEKTIRVKDSTPPVFVANFNSPGKSNGVILKWKAASDNQYALEPGAKISYEVWRKRGTAFISNSSPFNERSNQNVAVFENVVTSNAGDGFLTYIDNSSLIGNSDYHYVVCALDSTPNRNCFPTSIRTFVDDALAPVIVSFTHDKSGIKDKVWDLSLKYHDNNETANEDMEIKLYRKVTSSPIPSFVDSDPFVSIPALASGEVKVLNQNQTPIPFTENAKTFVHYRVVVIDKSGRPAQAVINPPIELDNELPANPVIGFSNSSPSREISAPFMRVTSASSNTAVVKFFKDNKCADPYKTDQGENIELSKINFTNPGAQIRVSTPYSVNNIYVVAETSAGTRGNCVLGGTYVFDAQAPIFLSSPLVIKAIPAYRIDAQSGNLLVSASLPAYDVDATQYCVGALLQGSTPGAAPCAANEWVNIPAGTLPTQGFEAALSVKMPQPANDGTYFVHAWLRDAAGNSGSSITHSVGLEIDTTPPLWTAEINVPVWTTDPTSVGDPSKVGSHSQIQVKGWATDATSGIDRYEWAVGSADATSNPSGEVSNIVSWTPFASNVVNAGNYSFTASSLTAVNGFSAMEHGKQYYVNFRALDKKGNARYRSGYFEVDLQDPAAPTISSPARNSSLSLGIGQALTLSGQCDSASGNATTLPSISNNGTSVVPSSLRCDNSSLNLRVLLSGLKLDQTSSRGIVLRTTKPSGRFKDSIAHNLNITTVCPTNYIKVPASATYNTSEFCVAKFEMRAATSNPLLDSNPALAAANGFSVAWDNSKHFPISTPYGGPAANMSHQTAVLACDRLNPVTGGSGNFQLITNDQWQAIVEAIVKTPTNWSNASVGSGGINSGWIGSWIFEGNKFIDTEGQNTSKGWLFLGNAWDGVLSAANDNNLFSFDGITSELEAGNTKGYKNNVSSAYGGRLKRTHRVGDGVIWDFSGNLTEHVRLTNNWCGNNSCKIGGLEAYDSHFAPNTNIVDIKTGDFSLQSTSSHSIFSAGYNISWFEPAGKGSLWTPTSNTSYGFGGLWRSDSTVSSKVITRGAYRSDEVITNGGGLASAFVRAGATSIPFEWTGFRCVANP